MSESLQQEQAELRARLIRLEAEMIETQVVLKEQRILLLGNGESDGLLHRTNRLEREGTVLNATIAKQLGSVVEDLREVTACLLGELSNGKRKDGLISQVNTHEKLLSDGKKLLWIIIGVCSGLLVTTLWDLLININK